MKQLTLKCVAPVDMVKAVDAVADISVVNIGTMSALGVADVPILEEVDRNNMSKFDEGCHVEPNGKLRKPPGHKPPRFRELLKEQGLDE